MSLTPLEQAEYDLLLAKETARQEREECESSLLAFFERAWREIDSAKLSVNWHHERIAEYLEAVSFGIERNLIINVPPRHTKSLLANVIWPAWTWAQPKERWAPLLGPHVKFLCVSYAATLAERMGLAMFRLVSGEWYQGHWGQQVQLRSDQSSRADFANTAGGERISNSIEGGILGRGGDIKICFPATEIIWTERGPLLIGDLVRSQEPALVWSHHQDRGLELSPLVGWHQNPGSEIVEVCLSDGRTLRCTPDHLLRSRTGWRRAALFRPGDELWVAVDEVPAYQRDRFVAHAVVSSQAPVACDAGSNLVDLLDRKFCAGVRYTARSAVWLLDVAQMSPTLAASHAHDGSLGDPKTLRNDGRRFGACECFHRLRRFQHRIATVFPKWKRAVAARVFDVLGSRAVGQPRETRIGAIAIDVPNLLSGRARPEKRERDNTMSFSINALASSAKRNTRVSVDDRADRAAGRAADAPEVGDGIAGEIFNRKPALARVRGVRFVGHVDITYCVTVAENHNMIMGTATIITSNCDDPQTRRGADSEKERMESIRGMSDLTTRVTDPRIAAQVLVMQRLHLNDATDWALKNWPENRVHLMYPARFDPDRASIGDPRTQRGELLWPEVWTEEELRNIEAGLKALDGDRLSDYAVAGQLQQSPIAKGGGIIKREWLEPWPPLGSDGSFPQDMVYYGVDGRPRIRYPAMEYVVACVDTAFTAKQQNDRSAMVVLGLFRAEGKGRIEPRGDGTFIRVADDYGFPKVLIMAGWAKRLELHGPPEQIPAGMSAQDWASPGMRLRRQESWGLVEWVADTCTRNKVDHLRILTLGQGHGLEQELRRLHSDADWGVDMEAERGDKEARAYAVQHLFSSRQIYYPMYEDGTLPSWCEPLVSEICDFPRGQYDDFVDACIGGLRHLREAGLLERREEWDRGEQRSMAWQSNRRVSLPYDV